ncbi:unnamed protein product [Echinostoma caproni]|uniref:EFG_C domain-containing protein n=1 Tax=Echinostoma caproni TaxID=27848 RepID=A0A183B4U7_9TREM|nr:unnamed protein product [Echinostoma caproni]
MFAVLRKRHGHVVSEDFREGENLFVISARLPVIESFGLADELRSRTNGIVNLPQLRPGGWELLDIDPTQRDLLFDGAGTKSGIIGIRSSNMADAFGTSARERKRGGKKMTGSSDSNIKQTYPTHRSDPSSTVLSKGKKVTNAGGPGGAAAPTDSDDEVIDDQIAQQTRVQRYLRDIRVRKGLSTNEQLVLYADKQRTLKKNK